MAYENPDWLIMLYLSGDNNLSPEMVRAIDEIGTQGGPPHVAITIQFDPLDAGFSSLRYILKPGQRLARHAGSDIPAQGAAIPPGAGKAGASKAPGENAADPQTLAGFVDWSVEHFPDSQRRMLVLSGHGSGAVGDFLTDDDATSKHRRSLTIRQLTVALKAATQRVLDNVKVSDRLKADLQQGRRLFDILGMDSCLMSMAEVAFQVRASVDFLIASEGFVPNGGWPYGSLLDRLRKRMAAGEDISPEAISRCIVSDYLTFYREYLPARVSVDIAACDLRDDNLDEVAATVESLVTGLDGLRDRDVRNAVILAHWSVQSFKFEQYVDLWDFSDLLASNLEEHHARKYADLIESCRNVQRALNTLVGRSRERWIDPSLGAANDGRQGVEGTEVQYARGLSVYFPWALPLRRESAHGPRFPDLSGYVGLEFAARSKWGAFVAASLAETMRPPRNDYVWASRGAKEEAHPITATTGKTPAAPKHTGPAVGRFGPDLGRFGPDLGRFGPDLGRFGPDLGRFGPDLGRFMSELFGLSACSTNPPQQRGVSDLPTESRQT